MSVGLGSNGARENRRVGIRLPRRRQLQHSIGSKGRQNPPLRISPRPSLPNPDLDWGLVQVQVRVPVLAQVLAQRSGGGVAQTERDQIGRKRLGWWC